MKSSRKICVVVTARPSYSRIKTVLDAIKQHSNLELQLVVAASALLDRYGSAVNVIEKDGFHISARVYNVLEGDNHATSAKTTGIGIIELSSVFGNLKPDIIVTVADRYETMATAIAASYMNIPLAHIQGGEVTGNIDEKVRHAITKLADYHFVASNDAYLRVINLGEETHRVFNTGCPSIDIAEELREDPSFQENPILKYGGVGGKLDVDEDYIVVLQHPVTDEFDESRRHIEETLKAIDKLEIPTFWFWPNVDAGSDGISKGIRSYREKNKISHIHFFKNMEPTDFLKLLVNSRCLIGNSSVGIRECSYLGVPVVNIGSRQNRRERGPNVIDVVYSEDKITKAVVTWLNAERPKSSNTYGVGKAGPIIAEILSEVELSISKTITF